MKRLDLIAFAGASNWPLWAGQQQGLFAHRGIDLALNLTPNSRHMARELHMGGAQIALTSIDNVIAYTEGVGEEPLDGPTDFFAFMGVDDGLLSVMAQPGIASVSELRGQTLAVDALTTGFAFVLREILALEGIDAADVTFATVGTGAERLAALKAGECGATLLNAPLCLAAEAAGKRRIVRARDILGPYQGIVGAARRSWARENAELVVAFIQAFRASLDWLSEPQNKMAAQALLAQKLPSLGKAVELAYEALIAQGGLTRSLKIDRDGVAHVIELRERYGKAGRPLGSPGDYIEDTFINAALG
jgi:ABC-type nitrate/sulfonate/bicarbonate transport system substrate-binding protein